MFYINVGPSPINDKIRLMKSHKYTNKQIVSILKEVLAAMQVKEYNFFQIRAYQNAVESIESLTMSVHDLWENEKLHTIPGVGGGLTQHLDDLFSKGKVREFDKALEDLPDGMFGLIGLRSVGAKRAFKLAKAFGLDKRGTAINKLKKHAKRGEISVLPGFGEKSEKDILEAIEQVKLTKDKKERMLLAHAEEIAERIKDYLEKSGLISKMEVLGSLRRRKETVGDLEFAVVTTEPEHVMSYFVKFPEVEDVLMKGPKRSSVVLKNGVQVDFRVSEPEAFGSMVQYFTGNRQHNILLRTYALEKGLSLSEYGVKSKKTGKIHETKTEEEFYEKVGLQYIPPEIRHGWDEIEFAEKNKLPNLVELGDIRGDLHIHTIASDGLNTLSEIVQGAKKLGYSYIGISDHVPSVQSKGRDEVERIIETKRKEVDQLNEVQNDIKVLFGYETSVLVDEEVNLPEDLLEKLDFVICGIHSSYNQSKNQLTKRLLAAIENKHVDIIPHPFGRLLNERDAYELDWIKILDAVKFHDKIIEINAHPQRLDLAFDLVKRAIDKGIKLIINTDAHDISQLSFMKYGVDVARRGWCTKENIVNTLPYSRFVKLLRMK